MNSQKETTHAQQELLDKKIDDLSDADSDQKAEDPSTHNHGSKTKDQKKKKKKGDVSSDHEHGPNCNHDHDHGKSHGKKKPKKNLFLVVYPLFTFFSCVYLQYYYFYIYFPSLFLRIICPIVNQVLLVLCLWSFWVTQTTQIKCQKMRNLPTALKGQKFQDKAYDVAAKYCDKCEYYKTPRTSHCTRCGQCVTKLDHHCIWIQRCVGFQNHRPFWQFIMYQSLGYLGYWYQTYYVIYQLYGSCNFWTTFPVHIYVLWGVTSLTMSILGSMIFLLFVFQTLCIITNHTTMDGVKTSRFCPLPFVEPRPYFYDNQYINLFDRGQIQNFKDFLGGNTILSLVIPNARQVENDFIVDKITPPPSQLQIEHFNGEEDRQYKMAAELRKTVKDIKNIYKGKKFIIKDRIVEFEQ